MPHASAIATWLLQIIAPALAAAREPVAVPAATDQAMRYYNSDNLLWFFSTLWGLAIPALFLFTGFSAKLRTWAAGAGRSWFATVAIYFIAFSILGFLIDLPLSFYQDYVREHAYGLSNQTLGKWGSDGLLNLLVNTVLGSLFLWVPYLLLARSPRRWWIYTSALAVPFLFLVIMIAPVWIVPLFNHTGPMKDKQLEAEIQALAHRAGIDGSRLLEIETSVDSRRLNAAVVGFGQTKRIMITDTMLGRMNSDEVLYAVGHEMGHYVLGHVPRTVLFISLLVAVTLGLASRICGFMLTRFGGRFGFNRLSDIASLPLLILVAQLLWLGVAPAFMAYSRAQEHEADRFGLEITRNNHAAATAFVKLQQDNLRNPRPGTLYKLWRAHHPPLGERIDFVNSYAPWEQGQPGLYDGLFEKKQTTLGQAGR
ncbi:MAG TPA: M48 family metallopeptidase [Patescibacteria group bacterium]|nr:M48 family metallopeptidase [Patescibacteria group bacterium]